MRTTFASAAALAGAMIAMVASACSASVSRNEDGNGSGGSGPGGSGPGGAGPGGSGGSGASTGGMASSLEIMGVPPDFSLMTEAALQAIARFPTGAQEDVTNIARWTSSDPADVEFRAGPGVAFRAGPRRVTVTAEHQGLTASATFQAACETMGALELPQMIGGLATGAILATKGAVFVGDYRVVSALSEIRRFDFAGGTTPVVEVAGKIAAMAIDEARSRLYFTEDNGQGHYLVRWVPTSGGVPTTIFDNGGGGGGAGGIFLAKGAVFFAAKDCTCLRVYDPSNDSVRDLALDVPFAPLRMVTDENHAYGYDAPAMNGPAIVRSVLLSGGPVATVAGGQGEVISIEILADSLYFGTGVGGIYAVPKSGGAVTELASTASYTRHFAVDANAVYYPRGPSIEAIPHNGEPFTLATCSDGTTPVHIEGLALDEGYVWATDSGGHRLLRIPK